MIKEGLLPYNLSILAVTTVVLLVDLPYNKDIVLVPSNKQR
jgi:hypothetical protein